MILASFDSESPNIGLVVQRLGLLEAAGVAIQFAQGPLQSGPGLSQGFAGILFCALSLKFAGGVHGVLSFSVDRCDTCMNGLVATEVKLNWHLPAGHLQGWQQVCRDRLVGLRNHAVTSSAMR
ncbi:hypothetical protein GWK36_00735 [Caldichromatium japonicum]|uniref:Uncharacterized protein n=1 Tax=Caldichromatium japonicum TaxID=2699430 RepID=A0A6G7VAF2_9GAMM|nr:hypothetical protein [Caldichromatium japonicum]QIK36767.1 hypothetical protein GWK36_00735 [Caldichromatium japonicum]